MIYSFFPSLIFSLFCDISILYILINDTSALVEIPVFCTFHFYDLLHTFYPDTCFYILIHDNSSAYQLSTVKFSNSILFAYSVDCFSILSAHNLLINYSLLKFVTPFMDISSLFTYVSLILCLTPTILCVTHILYLSYLRAIPPPNRFGV